MAKLQTVNAVALRILADKSQFENSLKSLNTKMGSTGKSGSKMGGMLKAGLAGAGVAAIALAKQVFDFSQMIGDMQQKVAAQTGATGGALNNLTGKIKGVADTFDQDFNEVLRAATVLSGEMGITTTDAIGLIEKGFATGANSTGEFLELIKEYPAQFAAAGLSAEQSIAVMSQSVTAGVYSDKGADTIKEGMLRLREMPKATQDALKGIGISSKQMSKDIADGTITTFEAMQQVSKKLAELPPQSKEVGTAVADIFGSAGEDAGLRYITNLQNIELNLNKLVEGSTDLQKAQLRISEASGDLNEVWASMFGDSSVMWNEIKATMMEVAVKALRSIITYSVKVINYFIEMYNNSVLFRGIIQGIIVYYKTFYSVVKTVIKGIISRVGTLGEKISFALNPKNWGGNFTKGMASIALDGMQEMADITKKGGEEIAAIFKEGYDNVMNNDPIELIKMPVFDEVEKNAAAAGAKTGKAFAAGAKAAITKADIPAEIQSIFSNVVDPVGAPATIDPKKKTKEEETFDIFGAQLDARRKAINEENRMNKDAIAGRLADDQLALDKRTAIAMAAPDVANTVLNTISQLNQISMDKELAMAGNNEAKKEKIRRKYAKKEKRIALLQAIINGALAITSAALTVPFVPAGLAAMIAAGVATAAQIAVISATPLAQGGIVTKPTYSLIGESGPEAVIPLSKANMSMRALQGQVVFRIQDDQLVGVLDQANKKNTYY